MKKNYLLFAVFFTMFVNAQWSLTGNAGTDPSINFLGTTDSKDFTLKTNGLERIRIFSNGSVGINTTSLHPSLTFGISGTARVTGNATNKDTFQVFNTLDNIDNGVDLMFMRYEKYQPNNPSVMSVSGLTTPTQYESLFNLKANGKLGIGTTNYSCTDCSSYRLFVKNGIKTEKVKVEIAAENGWADYVFKDDYKLMSMKELESFIDLNGHLPEVPTTEEAITNGIELKEMNILLLKKVEELTLHLIQQNKRIEKLEFKNKK